METGASAGLIGPGLARKQSVAYLGHLIWRMQMLSGQKIGLDTPKQGYKHPPRPRGRELGRDIDFMGEIV